MLSMDVNNVVKRIELQLGALERTLDEARTRIDCIERLFDKRIGQIRQHITLMSHSRDATVLIKIVDMLDEIERIVDKLNSIDITPVGSNETSLEGLAGEEYDKIESLVL